MILDRAREAVRDFVFHRQHAYRTTFNGALAPVVLADLAGFCRAMDTTFHPDPRMAALLEGRREVWLRIQNHLKMSQDDLFDLVTGNARRKQFTED